MKKNEQETGHGRTGREKRVICMRDVLIMSALFLFSLSISLIPLQSSSLPFNMDGYPQVKLAENIMDNDYAFKDDADLIEYNAKMPVLPFLLAVFSTLTGISPIHAAQLLVPLSTAILPSRTRKSPVRPQEKAQRRGHVASDTQKHPFRWG